MSREDRERFDAELPVDVKRAIEDADDYQWEVVADAVRAHLGLDGESVEDAYRHRIEELEQECERLETEIADREDRLEKARHDLEREREQLRQYLDERADYDERLDRLLEALADECGTTVAAYTSDLREIAREYHGRDTTDHREDVVADLRDRAAERGLAIKDRRLSLSKQTHQDTVTSTADGGEDIPDGIKKYDKQPTDVDADVAGGND